MMQVAYELTVDEGDGMVMVERTSREKPFSFITGLGAVLDAFEKRLEGLEEGADFEFVVPKDEAYGDYREEHVLELDKKLFAVDGKFDESHIYPGNVVPMQNEDGNHFDAIIEEVKDDKVVVNFNHPLAGHDLHFKGKVLTKREATKEEVEGFVRVMSGEECGCGHCGCGEGEGHHSEDCCRRRGEGGGGCCGGHKKGKDE